MYFYTQLKTWISELHSTMRMLAEHWPVYFLNMSSLLSLHDTGWMLFCCALKNEGN